MKPGEVNIRKTFGKTSAPWSVVYFAGLVRDALVRGDEAAALELSLKFFKEFNDSWESGDATFFRDLALCIERRCHNLNPTKLWLRQRLFTNIRHPERQTVFLTLEAIARELMQKKVVHHINLSLVYRYVTEIGAVAKNSKKPRTSFSL